MSRQLPHRNVTPIIEFLRELVRGKPMKYHALRFADELAARTQPPPDLPGGPYARTTDIYYFKRDARREVQPPIVVTTAKELRSGKEGIAATKMITPGNVYQPE